MIFWIVLALGVLTTAFFIWFNVWRKTNYWFGTSEKLWYSLVNLALGAAATIVVTLLVGAVAKHNLDEPEVYSNFDTQLVALASKDSISGELNAGIFASYGVIDGNRVLSYISKSDKGGMQLGQLDADKTVVYEGDENPHITTYKWVAYNRFLWPWELASGELYSVYVPKGSVTQDFNVAP